jgi:molybdate transport system substrate-binding protein
MINPSMRRIAAVALVFASATLATAAPAADLTVSAAASLTNAFNDLQKMFEAQNPGVEVHCNFAASGALLQQIAKGAPVDVFASADEKTMDDAANQSLIDPATRVDFVKNSLVVIVPSDAKTVPSTLNDVAAGARIAIGQPASVPVGRYTKAVLEQARLWTQIEPKMIGAQSVRQALDYVARGEVDSGFVYATDAAIMPDKVKVAFPVPTPNPVTYPIAVTKAATDHAMAQKFVRFVASPEAQTILAKYGFARP